MILFPVVAALVSTVFAIQLLTQYAHRKRLPQLAWGIAMTMYALASLAVAAGVSGGFDPTLFRMYWLFGALLNVPFLALGSVALLGRRLLTVVMLLGVVAATVIAIGAVASAPVHLDGAPTQIPRGSEVWGKGTLVSTLATYLSIPAFLIVVALAIASGKGRGLPPTRVRANRLIALGATIVAVGSVTARYGRGSVFSIALALGVVVMFLGFRLATRSPRAPADLLVLYTNEGCGLCEHAREALAAVGLEYEEVDIPDDHPYRLRTPVLESGGVVLAEGQITSAGLRRVIRMSPRAGR